jgi:hypothetical protein
MAMLNRCWINLLKSLLADMVSGAISTFRKCDLIEAGFVNIME